MRRVSLAIGLGAAVCCVVALSMFLAAAPVPAADVAARFQAAVDQFDRLRKNPDSNGRRDLWQALDSRFAALAKAAGKDPLRARALYYQAWTNAELGRRSYLEADFEAAAALYRQLAGTYPSHAWADDALLRRADILAGPLKRPAEARADLERLLARYPKGDMASRAQTLLAGLGDVPAPTVAPATATARNEKPAQPPAPAKGQTQAAASPARPATLSRLAVDPSPGGGRLTLTLDRETTFRYQVLDQKRPGGEPVKRLYIDLDNTRTGQGLPAEKTLRQGPRLPPAGRLFHPGNRARGA